MTTVHNTLPKGTGYWDLTDYPWGGCFRRAQFDLKVHVVEILDPARPHGRVIVRTVNGRRLGLEHGNVLVQPIQWRNVYTWTNHRRNQFARSPRPRRSAKRRGKG